MTSVKGAEARKYGRPPFPVKFHDTEAKNPKFTYNKVEFEWQQGGFKEPRGTTKYGN
jgi:hypothetical protein